MPISYIYTGQPMTGTAQDNFMIAYAGSTGASNNTVNAGDGDDWVMGDSSDTWIPNASYLNGSIANAFNLETITSTWTTDENPLIGSPSVAHTTAIVEATVGQSEFFRVDVGAGQSITIDLDFASGSAIGTSRDLVVELMDGAGNVLASADDSTLLQGGLGSFANSPGTQNSYDPYLTFVAVAGGTYYINVRPFGGGPGSTFTENNTFVLNVSVSGHATGAASVMGADTINGDAGADALFGQGGSDVINGGADDDLIHGGSGVDTVHGDGGNDTLHGGEGTEENIHGDDGNDILWSGGEGHYYGDAGDDLVYAGLTSGVNEILDGGTGVDTVDTTAWNGAYSVNLTTGATNFGESFTNFENLTSGGGDDTLTGNAQANIIRAGGGADTVNGADGADTLFGEQGTDTLLGWVGDDVLWGGSGAANTLQGGVGNDRYVIETVGDSIVEFAGEGTDTIESRLNAYTLTAANVENLLFGGFGNFTGTGSAGSNVITGGAGDDVLAGRGGADTLVGGDGTDTADYSLAAAAVTASLAANVASNDGDGLSDTFSGIENLTGSAFNDLLMGGATANLLRGGAGTDTLVGFGGNDVLWGGAGAANTVQGGTGDDLFVLEANDSVVENAGEGNDTVDARIAIYNLANHVENLIFGGVGAFTGTGNALNNSLTGGAGADTLRGGGGADAINGGGGFDTADYSLAAAGVVARLDINAATNDGDGATDTFNSIEALTGSAFNDTLFSGAAGDTLRGGLGADTLLGYGGNDILWGGQGQANTLQGGIGDDLYVLDAYDSVVEFAGEGYDVIEARVGACVMGANVEEMYYFGALKFYGTGNAGNNIITAGVGDDILKGMGGDDTLHGGAGVDEIQLRGVGANYTITAEGAGYRIVDGVAGRDGSTYVSSIEIVRFLGNNTTTVLTYPPPGPAPLEPVDKGAAGPQVLPGLIDDEPFVLPAAADKAPDDEALVLPGLEEPLAPGRLALLPDDAGLAVQGPHGPHPLHVDGLVRGDDWQL